LVLLREALARFGTMRSVDTGAARLGRTRAAGDAAGLGGMRDGFSVERVWFEQVGFRKALISVSKFAFNLLR
jgi:hypothetical protein